jgi:hypothetical protein
MVVESLKSSKRQSKTVLFFDNLVVTTSILIFSAILCWILEIDRSSSIRGAGRKLASKSNPFVVHKPSFGTVKDYKKLKGLILAQNERWRRGLGMQVVRES